MAELTRHVALFDDKGILQQFGPGDDVPAWARKKIINPQVWDDYDPDAPADDDGTDAHTGDGPPPKSGKGGGIRAWRKYAKDHGVDADDLSDVDEVVAELEQAGVATE